jgi:hypothetical protein
MQPPLCSQTVARPLLSFPYRFCVNLVGCCMHLLIGGRLKSQQFFFINLFASESNGRIDLTAFSPIVIALRAASLKHIPTIRPLSGWLLCPTIKQKPSKSDAPPPSLFYFFSSLHFPPDLMGKRSPPRVPPIRIASPLSPPPPNPSFGWLLHVRSKWRPPKTGALPISQFVDGRHFGAPNKGTKRCAHEPGRRAPLLGSWGAATHLFGSMADDAMEREGKAAGGSGQRLMVLCVCCV